MFSMDPKLPTEDRKNPFISIVVPAYNESSNIRPLYRELSKVLSSLTNSWEIIFADDGSDDGTWDEIVALHKIDNVQRGYACR